MSKKIEDITHMVVKLVHESKKGRDKWPIGDIPKLPPKPVVKRDKWPVGEPVRIPLKGVRLGTGDRWPVGVVLPTKPERDLLSTKVMKGFGVKVKILKSTKLNDLAATIHSLINLEEK